MTALRVLRLRGAAAIDSQMFSLTKSFCFFDRAGSLQVESTVLGKGDIKLFCVRSTGHEVALTEETHLNVILPVRGGLTAATPEADYGARAGEMLLFPPNERRTVVERDADGLYEALVLAVPFSQFRASDGCWRNRRPVDVPSQKVPPSPVTAALAERLREHLMALRQAPPGDWAEAASEQVGAIVEDLVGDIVSSVMRPASLHRATTGSLRQVKLAEDFMRQHHAKPIRIADVAAFVHLSMRGLQAAFLRFRGLSPHESLTRCRLEAARLLLLEGRPHDRITDVALQVGCPHHGRFARTYANRFGESPSATWKRAQSG